MPDGQTFRAKFGPRGVIKSSADGKIEDTGPLTKKRMETLDDETSEAAIAFIKEQTVSGNHGLFGGVERVCILEHM